MGRRERARRSASQETSCNWDVKSILHPWPARRRRGGNHDCSSHVRARARILSSFSFRYLPVAFLRYRASPRATPDARIERPRRRSRGPPVADADVIVSRRRRASPLGAHRRRGRFTFDDLARGRYDLTASRAGAGRRRARRRGQHRARRDARHHAACQRRHRNAGRLGGADRSAAVAHARQRDRHPRPRDRSARSSRRSAPRCARCPA